MKQTISAILIIAGLLCLSCEFDPVVDPQSLLPPEPTPLTIEDDFIKLLESIIGNTYEVESSALLIEDTEEEYSFTVSKSETVYYLWGNTTSRSYPIVFDIYGYPQILSTGHEDLDLTIQGDGSQITFITEGTSYAYRRK